MTMKRNAKAEAQRMVSPQADGYTTTEFAHPQKRRDALATRGHLRMTPAEVAALRLQRGAKNGHDIDNTVQEFRTSQLRAKSIIRKLIG
jgi:hypothetical protein